MKKIKVLLVLIMIVNMLVPINARADTDNLETESAEIQIEESSLSDNFLPIYDVKENLIEAEIISEIRETIDNEIFNDETLNTLDIKVVNLEGVHLPNVKFELYDKQGGFICNINYDGQDDFMKIPLENGEYKLKQTETHREHVIYSEELMITVPGELVILNDYRYYDIRIKTLNSADLSPVESTIEVYNGKYPLQTLKTTFTDSAIAKVRAGAYIVEQTNVHKYYKEHKALKTFEIGDDTPIMPPPGGMIDIDSFIDKDVEIVFYNDIKTKDIVLYAVQHNIENPDMYTYVAPDDLNGLTAIVTRLQDSSEQEEIITYAEYNTNGDNSSINLSNISYGNYKIEYSINNEKYEQGIYTQEFVVDDSFESFNMYFTPLREDSCCCDDGCEKDCECDCGECENVKKETGTLVLKLIDAETRNEITDRTLNIKINTSKAHYNSGTNYTVFSGEEIKLKPYEDYYIHYMDTKWSYLGEIKVDANETTIVQIYTQDGYDEIDTVFARIKAREYENGSSKVLESLDGFSFDIIAADTYYENITASENSNYIAVELPMGRIYFARPSLYPYYFTERTGYPNSNYTLGMYNLNSSYYSTAYIDFVRFSGKINIKLVDENNNTVKDNAFFSLYADESDESLLCVENLIEGIKQITLNGGTYYIAESDSNGKALYDKISFTLTDKNSPLNVNLVRSLEPDECCCGGECEADCECGCEGCPNIQEPEPDPDECCCGGECEADCECGCEGCPNIQEPEPDPDECCCGGECKTDCECGCEGCPNIQEPEPDPDECCCGGECEADCECGCEGCPNIQEPEPDECCCGGECETDCECGCVGCPNIQEPEPDPDECCCGGECKTDCECGCEGCPNIQEPEPDPDECCCGGECEADCECGCEGCPNIQEPEPDPDECCCGGECEADCECGCEGCPNIQEPEPDPDECCCGGECEADCECGCEGCPNIQEPEPDPDECCCGGECEADCECGCEGCPNIQEPEPDPDKGKKSSGGGSTRILKKEFIFDISDNHLAYIFGYPDGTVKPLSNITRAEMASVFYRLMSDEAKAQYYSIANDYSDIELTHWANTAISTIDAAGVITGYDRDFRPDDAITRAELCTMIALLFSEDINNDEQFQDLHWAADSMDFISDKNWFVKKEHAGYPQAQVTRAEAIYMLNRVLNRSLENTDSITENQLTIYPDNLINSWYYYDVIEATHNHNASTNENGLEIWIDNEK